MKEALKLALEAFDSMIGRKPERVEQAITAIKEALAQPEQEPVAWFSTLPDGRLSIKIVGKPTEGNWEPLYTTPPQRTWVGLTDKEVGDLSDFAYANDEEFVRNVEKYLKEKNNG